jgi:Dyp-type peroxidase family
LVEVFKNISYKKCRERESVFKIFINQKLIQMPLVLTESKVSNKPPFTEMLNDLQANILKHHGRNFAFHLFLSVKPGKSAAAKNWIGNFATSKITSTAKQLIDSAVRKNKGIDGGTVYNLSISSTGYNNLQIETALKPDSPAFTEGMKNRSAKLADDAAKREPAFNNDMDVLIIVAHAEEAVAVERKNNLLLELQDFFNVVKVQKGEVLRNGKIGIEHFGYADGISQPIFLETEINKQSGNTIWKDEAKLSLALVKDKGGLFEDSYGSYLVFRKLEQNVKAFKAAEKTLPAVKKADGTGNDELAGAMVVGRFEDGTEVINASSERGNTAESDLKNDFDYATENSAAKCPFHAHIRVTNPRADAGNTDIDSFVRNVRLVRRGIPFNDAGRVGTEGEPEGGIGLLFMCYQSSIEDQFEFIQTDWANQGVVSGQRVGQDGIIGQGQNDIPKQLPAQWGISGNENKCEFSNHKSGFVTMRGGEYFYTPSISFLKSLTINNTTMTKKVMDVTELTLNIQKTNPPSLVISCNGHVNSGGWSHGKLVPFVYVMPPADGIYEFDFVANAPTGIVIQKITPITAEEFVWEDFPAGLKGVKVYASQNNITEFIEAEKSERRSRKPTVPFNKVTTEELQVLKSKNDAFFITNAFIWEDVLHVTAQYGGGCKKHEFQLVWDGTETRSLPPQISLSLIHNSNNDPCEALVSQELQIVLSTLITKPAEINLEGWAKCLSCGAVTNEKAVV